LELEALGPVDVNQGQRHGVAHVADGGAAFFDNNHRVVSIRVAHDREVGPEEPFDEYEVCALCGLSLRVGVLLSAVHPNGALT
jgi:hypothetical protein